MFGADRALLLTEAMLLAKLAMVAAGYPFVLAGRSLRARCAAACRPAIRIQDRVLVTDRRPRENRRRWRRRTVTGASALIRPASCR